MCGGVLMGKCLIYGEAEQWFYSIIHIKAPFLSRIAHECPRHSRENSNLGVLLCTLENELVVRNIPRILKHILFHFMKPPSDTLLCYS